MAMAAKKTIPNMMRSDTTSQSYPIEIDHRLFPGNLSLRDNSRLVVRFWPDFYFSVNRVNRESSQLIQR